MVAVAVVVGVVIAQFNGSPDVRSLGLLIACSLPVFAAGITEDLTKSVSTSNACVSVAMNGASLVDTSCRRYFGAAPCGVCNHFLIVLRDRLVRRRISLIVSPSR